MLGSAGVVGRWRRQRRFVGQKQGTTARAATRRRPRSTLRTIANEIVAEIDGSLSDAQADELARRHGLCASGIAEFSADRRHHRPVPHHRPPLGRDRQPRTRRRRQRSLGAAEFPLFAAGPEGGVDRGRSRAIRARETSIARGAYARPRRQCHHRRDRFRNRRQTSGTRQLDCGQLRCARQQGRSACPRHRHCRRDRGACAADGKRAGGADFGDPRLRRGAERRGKHVVRDPEGAGLRRRAWRADRQYELRRPEGCADRTRLSPPRPPRAS